jgi:hypothetical protein
MMFQALAVFNFDHGQPLNSLDLTGAFGPFSAEVGIGLGVGILAVAVLTAFIDSWWTARQAAKAGSTLNTAEKPAGTLRKAA